IIFFIIFFNYFENTIRFDKPIRINWLNIKSILYDFQLIILLVPFTFLTIYFLLTKKYEDKNEMFLLLSILFGTFVVWIFELFNIYGRYIFVFKLHQTVWIFWNISVILILFYFKDNFKIKTKKIVSTTLLAIFIILLSSSVIYLIVTSISETSKFTPNYGRNYLTIDSMEFLKQNYPKEYEAISWINKNIKGNHVILEYPSESYEFYPRPSTFTGLTAVVEWKDHAEQVTLNDTNKMANLVHLIYNSTDLNEAIKIIKEIKIEYIYIGNLEKQNYSNIGLKKFENNNYFSIVYKNDEVFLFKFNDKLE
ncbi:MAG: hypothetical protein KQA41_04320, partial [Candidatus Aenigmarchaeota archaeon]|nr:hypothetical protein [Candidatus Aenigmarchaeota archaeon]